MKRASKEAAGAERAFVEKAMQLVRTKLYPQISDSAFRREWQDLLLAVSEPAAYMKERGLSGTAGLYLKILRRVLEDLLEKSERVLHAHNRPQILRAWIQKELRFRGDTYLDETKAAASRATGAIAAQILKGVQPVAARDQSAALTDTLVAARGLIVPPATYRKRS